MMKIGIAGMSNIKTIRKTKIRSMPKTFKDDLHLDIYIMSKQRMMMEQEMMAINKRKITLEADLKALNKKIKRAERMIARRENSRKRTAEKNLKTMVMGY